MIGMRHFREEIEKYFLLNYATTESHFIVFLKQKKTILSFDSYAGPLRILNCLFV